jgi:prepilin-type N-terminal cleavage/methylation domain-containing protein
MQTRYKYKGFTLLEILLVITLIGILAGIALVVINPNRQLAQARNLIRQSDINTIYNALEIYTIRNRGNLFPELDELYKEVCDTGIANPSQVPVELCIGKVNLSALVPDYLKQIPKDPLAKDLASTGYFISKGDKNQISIKADRAELSQNIAILVPQKLTPNCNAITYTDRKIVIPYTGGVSGYNYVSQTITSTGATGLTATLATGTLANSGNLEYNVSGINSGSEAANFSISDISNTFATCNNTNIAVNQFCPTGYIAVPGNTLYGTNNFCVMKYEAKATTPAAITQAAGNPQVNISQTNAITACSLNGAGYGLINNNEWMTIARNIEGQGVNWTGGTVGSGGLWRGHSDGSPNNALAASTDNDPYFGTGNTSPSIERRTHTLSNGETIWDLSGNVWEWTSDTIQGQNKPNNSSGNLWQQWTAISNFGTLNYDLTRPSNPAWNSSQNMGQYYAGTVTGTTTFAFRRGGSWYNATTSAGVFTLNLNTAPSDTASTFGFRCVLR